MRLYPAQSLEWKGDGLHLDGKGKAPVTLVPDDKWPNMWRVRCPGGRLSDMANRVWAKDASITIALRLLNGKEKATEAPYRRSAAEGVGLLTPKPQNAP